MNNNWFYDKAGNLVEVVSKPFTAKVSKTGTIKLVTITKQPPTHIGNMGDNVGFSKVG